MNARRSSTNNWQHSCVLDWIASPVDAALQYVNTEHTTRYLTYNNWRLGVYMEQDWRGLDGTEKAVAAEWSLCAVPPTERFSSRGLVRVQWEREDYRAHSSIEVL